MERSSMQTIGALISLLLSLSQCAPPPVNSGPPNNAGARSNPARAFRQNGEQRGAGTSGGEHPALDGGGDADRPQWARRRQQQPAVSASKEITDEFDREGGGGGGGQVPVRNTAGRHGEPVKSVLGEPVSAVVNRRKPTLSSNPSSNPLDFSNLFGGGGGGLTDLLGGGGGGNGDVFNTLANQFLETVGGGLTNGNNGNGGGGGGAGDILGQITGGGGGGLPDPTSILGNLPDPSAILGGGGGGGGGDPITDALGGLLGGGGGGNPLDAILGG